MTIRPTNTCLRAREDVSAHLDGELSELEQARLAAHLQACPACASFARELGSVADSLRAAPLERPVVEIWLPRRRPAALRTVPARVAAVAAAAAAVVVSFAAGHDVASSGRDAGPAALPPVPAARADAVERHVLGMLRDDQAGPGGRLIFI